MNWMYIDKEGNPAFAAIFEQATPFREGIASVRSNGFVRFIKPTGELAFEGQFSERSSSSFGLIRMTSGRLKGYIDQRGQWRIPAKYHSAQHFCEGVASVRIGTEAVFIDVCGETVLDPKSSILGSLSCGRAIVRYQGHYYYINIRGDSIAGPFDACEDFCDGVAWVFKNDEIWFINDAGEKVFKPDAADVAGYCAEDRIAFESHFGEHGFYDKMGQVVVTPRFDDVRPFREGVAWCSLDGKQGFIDHAGQVLFMESFNYLDDLHDGLAGFSRDGKRYGFCDKYGRIVIPEEWDRVNCFSEGLATVCMS